MNLKKYDFTRQRIRRLIVAGLFILISLIILSGVYRKWGFHRQKKIVVGVFAGSYWGIENGYYYRILDEAINRFRQNHPD